MTEKGLTCHKSSLQIAGNVCYMPAASPSVATECLLCISRGNCRRTTFAIFFMSKVGNLWNRISPLPRESFYFDTERRLPVTTMLLCFDTSTLYSVATRTWLIINESSRRAVTFFFTKHFWTIQWHWILSLLWQCLVSRHRVGQKKLQHVRYSSTCGLSQLCPAVLASANHHPFFFCLWSHNWGRIRHVLLLKVDGSPCQFSFIYFREINSTTQIVMKVVVWMLSSRHLRTFWIMSRYETMC